MSRSIYDALRDAIVGGELPAGHALRERALAARFATSRTPVREALRQLEQDGWAARGALREAVLLEAAQCLADGRPADPELLRERDLGEALPGRDVAAHDPLT